MTPTLTPSEGRLNIVARLGRRWAQVFKLADSKGPLDLTGCMATFSIFTADGVEVIDAQSGLTIYPAGRIEVSIAASVLDSIQEGRYRYALEITWSTGDVQTLLAGVFCLDDEVPG